MPSPSSMAVNPASPSPGLPRPRKRNFAVGCGSKGGADACSTCARPAWLPRGRPRRGAIFRRTPTEATLAQLEFDTTLPARAPVLGPADLLTGLRLPLAAAFLLVDDPAVRLAVLLLAAASDMVDGWLARRFGPSRLGVFLDPVADKLFMAAAFWVVAVSGRLAPYEVVGVLLRDIVAAFAFVVTAWTGRASTIPARAGGKAVTLAQNFTLLAFLLRPDLLRPLAWATSAIAIYAIWDYVRARTARRAVGSDAPGSQHGQ